MITDPYECACEGQFLGSFATGREALAYAHRYVDLADCPVDVLDARRKTVLIIVHPSAPEASSA